MEQNISNMEAAVEAVLFTKRIFRSGVLSETAPGS